ARPGRARPRSRAPACRPWRSLRTWAQSVARTPPAASQQGLVEDAPPPVARRALLCERLDQPLGDPLAGHLDQAEVGDVRDLGAGLVTGEGLPEDPCHLGPVRPDLHVDEVDDDDAPDVPQPEL